MVMYRTRHWDNDIKECMMSKVTDKSVFWINSRGKEEREAKQGNESPDSPYTSFQETDSRI